MNETYLPILLISSSALLDTYAAYVFKQAFKGDRSIKYRSIRDLLNLSIVICRNSFMLSGLFAYMLAPTAWFFALNGIDLSVGYPLLVAFHLVFVLLFAMIFLREGLNRNKMIGCACIFFSVCCLSVN
jgi:multidrug transporter EmrE-like cation transporter